MSHKINEKTVLCFGDSNTWGADPSGGPRYDRTTRWPCILQQELGDGFHIVEEGLCGRTTVWDDPLEGSKNGLAHLEPLLQTHAPLDLLIIMLGTNDLKNRFGVSATDVSWGIRRLIDCACNNADAFANGTPEILVLCPPPFADMSRVELKDIFIGGEEKSHQLAPRLQRVCDERQIQMVNAGELIMSSATDGIHLDASEHATLGKAVAAHVRNHLKRPPVEQ